MEETHGNYQKKKLLTQPLTLQEEKIIANFVIDKIERKLKPFFVRKKRRK